MSRAHPPAIAAALLLSGAALLAGCGSSTTTGSVASTPAGTETTTAATSAQGEASTSTSSAASATSSGPPVGSNGGTPASSTRAAPEPAFTEGQASAEGLSGAEAILHARGFTAADPSEYHEDQALRVLIGSRTGDQEQAFFFINGRYIGTDAKEPSGEVQVLSQSDTEVTLGYALYRQGNALCCPAGGTARVRFQLDNGLLTTLDRIPPVQSSSGGFRQ